jgi:hypothetical protein
MLADGRMGGDAGLDERLTKGCILNQVQDEKGQEVEWLRHRD